MSQIPGTSNFIAETGPATNSDFPLTDSQAMARSGQRKTVRLENGILMTAFSTYTEEIIGFAPQRAVSIALSKTDGKNWTKPMENIFAPFAKKTKILASFNPALAIAQDGQVHMAFRAAPHANPAFTSIWYARCTADGKTWSQPVPLAPVGSERHRPPAIAAGPDKQVYIAFDYEGSLFFAASADLGASWSPPKLLIKATSGDTHPSMTVDKAGVIYIALSSKQGHIHCMRSTDQGANWLRRTIYGSVHAGGSYPSIALDKDDKPAIAFVAFNSGANPDFYIAIQVHHQVGNWSNTWAGQVVDAGYESVDELLMPSLAITGDNVFQVAYLRRVGLVNQQWEKWPRQVMFSQSENWTSWTTPQQVTMALIITKQPQTWPNLYWQPQAAAQQGFLVVWGGKKENAKTPGTPWYARSFVSDDFAL